MRTPVTLVFFIAPVLAMFLFVNEPQHWLAEGSSLYVFPELLYAYANYRLTSLHMTLDLTQFYGFLKVKDTNFIEP